jgi:DnaB-like helicase C terminal domain
MIAGPPGSMKTVLALNIVRRMGLQVPTLYHSSDSDDFTMASRTLAMSQNLQTSDAETEVMLQTKRAYESLKDYQHVRWSFKSSPTLEHMWNEAEAYRELKGTYPHHTVIDIMMDVDYEGAGEQNYWALMAELKDMARAQETAITVVHHTSESAKGGSPPPRSAIMGKANQLPTLILTLWGDSHRGTLDVATVKNRFGPQDAMGKRYFQMKADPATCFIDESDVEMLFDSNETEDEEW